MKSQCHNWIAYAIAEAKLEIKGSEVFLVVLFQYITSREDLVILVCNKNCSIVELIPSFRNFVHKIWSNHL